MFTLLPNPPAASRSASRAGFRWGDKGTHTSRTMMLEELSTLLSGIAPDAPRTDYAVAITQDNRLGKPTAATRAATNQRLGELYALDPAVPVFRVFRRLWDADPRGRPLLALLLALARDPLLAATAVYIAGLRPGDDVQRQPLRQAIRAAVGERLNDSTLDKVARNAASSWAQSGHLLGRTFKRRRKVEGTPGSVAFALYLADVAGFSGEERFTSGWVAILDCSAGRAQELTFEAKRHGLLDVRIGGAVTEIGFDRMDPVAGRR